MRGWDARIEMNIATRMIRRPPSARGFRGCPGYPCLCVGTRSGFEEYEGVTPAWHRTERVADSGHRPVDERDETRITEK